MTGKGNLYSIFRKILKEDLKDRNCIQSLYFILSPPSNNRLSMTGNFNISSYSVTFIWYLWYFVYLHTRHKDSLPLNLQWNVTRLYTLSVSIRKAIHLFDFTRMSNFPFVYSGYSCQIQRKLRKTKQEVK